MSVATYIRGYGRDSQLLRVTANYLIPMKTQWLQLILSAEGDSLASSPCSGFEVRQPAPLKRQDVWGVQPPKPLGWGQGGRAPGGGIAA
jgi:hypothetical protein